MGKPALIRAAVGHSPLRTIPDVAKAVGVSPSVLNRWMAGSKAGRQPGPEDLEALSNACEVPLWFLMNGFREPEGESAQTEHRLRLIEQELEALAPLREEIVDWMREIDARLQRAGLPAHDDADSETDTHSTLEDRREGQV